MNCIYLQNAFGSKTSRSKSNLASPPVVDVEATLEVRLGSASSKPPDKVESILESGSPALLDRTSRSTNDVASRIVSVRMVGMDSSIVSNAHKDANITALA
jgi:hypothetical protein